MKKFVKIAAIVVAVVLVIALVAPMVLRGKIAEIVKREANAMLDARLDFEKLDISLLRHFPRASLDLKGLTLVGEEPFAGDTIVAAQRISVVVNVMSLFSDEGFEVTKIILSEPALHAHKLADGRVNWDVVKASEEAQGEEETPADAEPSSFRLSVRDFRISDAAIRYEDDSTGMRFSTAPLSLRLRGDMSADQTDLDLRLTAKGMRLVSGGIPMLSGAEAELDAVIAADLANSRFTFSQNKLRLNAIEVGLDGWVELKDDAVAMDVTAGCDKVQFKDVLSLVPAFYTRDFRNLAAGGELSMARRFRRSNSGRRCATAASSTRRCPRRWTASTSTSGSPIPAAWRIRPNSTSRNSRSGWPGIRFRRRPMRPIWSATRRSVPRWTAVSIWGPSERCIRSKRGWS